MCNLVEYVVIGANDSEWSYYSIETIIDEYTLVRLWPIDYTMVVI